MHRRRPEDGHHGVADVLLDDAAVPIDPVPDLVEVELVAVADVLRVGAVGSSGRAHDVDEQDRDELPLLRAGAAGELEPARGAEPGAVGDLRAAPGAGHQARIVGRDDAARRGWVGTGDKFDPYNLTVPIMPGTFVTHYGNRVHWDGAKDEDVTLLIIGEGPVTTARVEEAR